jgi:hypothetical protein
VVVRAGRGLGVPRLDRLLQRHFALTRSPGQLADGQAVEITLNREGSTPFSSSVTLIEETRYLRVLRTGTGFRLEAEESWIDLDPARGVATGILRDGFWDLPELTQRDFALQTLVILLRDRHHYGLHASGVGRDGTGLLVVGPSGRGKTTLALSLLSTGWGFLGDDVVALHQVDGTVEARAVRRSMSCTPTTLARFGLEGAKQGDDEKQLYDVGVTSPAQVVDRLLPQLVVFPQVIDRPFSKLELLPQSAVIAGLGSSMAGIMTDPVWAERQLGVVASLAGQSAGYRMLAGRDVFEDPPRVARLLTEAGRG